VAVAGCGEAGEREGGRVETMVSEPEEPGGSQEALEISTSRGTVRGILYPVESATGAVAMVGGAGGVI
jgi:hypothetical protein